MSKLQPYPKYKPIAYDYVSQLPEGWELLPNIAIFQERKERIPDEMELLSVSISKGVVRQIDMDKKDISSQDKSNYKVVRKGDIAYGMEFRKGAVGYSIFDGKVSPVYTVLKQREGKYKINPIFFHYMFRTIFYKNYIWRNVYGIGEHFLPLRFNDFKRMYSIVPPLAEQNAIVAYLDAKTQQIQDFITKKQKLIQLLEEKKKAVIFDECGKYSSSKKKIKFVAKICNGQDQKSIEVRNGKYAIYGSGGEIGRTNSFLHNKPSVLLGRKGTIDKPIFVREPFWSIDTAFFTIIDENKIIPEFFYYACHFIPFEEFTYGSAIPSMTQSILNNVEIPVPNLETQNHLLEKIKLKRELITQAITQAQLEIEKLKEYQEILITQVVTGQLQVPVA